MRLRQLVLAAAFTVGFGAAASASPLATEAYDALLLRDASAAFMKWKGHKGHKGWKGGHPGRHLGWRAGHPGRHLGWERGRHRGWAKKARYRGAYWR